MNLCKKCTHSGAPGKQRVLYQCDITKMYVSPKETCGDYEVIEK